MIYNDSDIKYKDCTRTTIIDTDLKLHNKHVILYLDAAEYAELVNIMHSKQYITSGTVISRLKRKINSRNAEKIKKTLKRG